MSRARATVGHRRLELSVADAAERAGLSPEYVADLLDVEVGTTDSEVVHREHGLQLHRYEPADRTQSTPVLLVYALVNRPYILDLEPDRSVVRRLLEAGFEVYLVDWGRPSPLDRSLGLADYVSRYLDGCVAAVRERTGTDVHLLGYCMGGTLSLLYAATNPDPVRTLSLLATPVAFDGRGGVLEQWAEQLDPDLVVEALGNVPAELLALGFAMVDPVDQFVGKYVPLYENIEDESFVRTFVRMERWIWDGVDLAGETYREFLTEFYRENSLAAGEYCLDGQPVDLEQIEVPVQQLVGERDQLVPPESSRPLNDLIGSDDERIVEFPAGHVGLSVSRSAHADLWPDACAWLADRDGA